MFPQFLLITLLLTALPATNSADSPNDLVAYTPGTCGVVIAAPHGGSLRPSDIADRTDGCLGADGRTCRWEKGCSPASDTACSAGGGADAYTQQIAALVVQLLSNTYNCVPHFVRSNLHRNKLDPNREIDEAAQGDPTAEAAWRVYHENYMVTALESIRAAFGRGLVIDIHGQGHSEQWTEIGYTLSRAELNAGPTDLTGSSIRGLASRSRLSAAELISGDLSFGSFLEASGYKAVPSRSIPSPGNGNYFIGGYTIQRYGSRASGEVDAIQVEIPSGLRMDLAKREKFSADLARVIDNFRTAHGYKAV